VLTGELSPTAVQRRVRARYPEAQPLPDRPDLDAFVKPFGLSWEPVRGVYIRPGERRATQHTSYSALTTLPSISTSKKALDPRVIALSEFEEQVRNTIETSRLKILGVRANWAREAALALTDVFGLRRISLDTELLDAIHAVMDENDIDPDLVHAADRGGRSGRDWEELQGLVEQAAGKVADKLFPPAEPLLLVQPGLLARYQLESFLRTMTAAARERASAAIFLLVPSHDTAGVPRINEELSIPEVGRPESLWVPPEWIKERRKAA
jgi:hypothetical protein